MPNSIGVNGLSLATRDELEAQYTAAFQSIYGADIDLSSSSPDGQMMNIFIQSVLDLQDLLAQIYSTFDPDQAIGVILDQRVAINGIQRKGGTYTVQPVKIFTTTAVPILYGLDQTIEPPYTVADGSGNQYQLITSVPNFNPGSAGSVLLFQAANPGAIQSAVGDITVPVTIVLGIGGGPANTGIYNVSPYTTLGVDEETDSELKIRRQQSVALSSQGYLSGLEAALNNINGIGSVKVYENDADVTSIGAGGVPAGIPGHSIWVIVQDSPSYPISSVSPYSAGTTYQVGSLVQSGGIIYASGRNNNTGNSVSDSSWWWRFDQVAWAMYLKRNAGCGTYGSIPVAVTQMDGSQFVVNYDKVVSQPLYITFYASSLSSGIVPNINLIKQKLPSVFVPGVNQEVNINALATAVQSIDPNTLVTFSGAGTPGTGGFSASAGGTYTNTLNPSAANKQFTLDPNNIIVLPMILTADNLSVATTFTTQLKGLGGYGTLTYSFQTNNSGGSVNSSSGLYTAGSTGGVTDVLLVTDSNGNTATLNISVI